MMESINVQSVAVDIAPVAESKEPSEVQNINEAEMRAEEIAEQKNINKIEQEKTAKQDKVSKQEEMNTRDLSKIVARVNSFVQAMGTNVSFSVDESSDEHVILVKERDSGDLIRKIPSDEALRVQQRMDEITGIIYQNQA